MIVLTGANGQLGRAIVNHLLIRIKGHQIGVSVRDPAKAQDLAAQGVRVRQGDFTDPDRLPHAFEGATQVLFVSSGAQAHGGDSVAEHRAAIEAAKAAGARRILYTSHMAVSRTSQFPPMEVHAATEEMLAGCGVAWTSLRNGFYASRAMQEVSGAMQSGVISAPADGKVSWTAHADLAEAAAIILTEEGRFDGPTPPLTGSEALDFADIATIMTDLLGRPIKRELISDNELEQTIKACGLHPAIVKIAVGYFTAARAGEFAKVDPTLEQLLGRKPATIRSLIAALIKT